MNAYTRNYVASGLAASPAILHELLKDLSPAQADSRPDPERFTIREAVAHLADWEVIWRGRIERILTETEPMLENLDEGEIAIQNRYHETDVAEQAARFARERAGLVETLRSLAPEQWERIGRHSSWNGITVDGFAALVLGHDGYHHQQVIEQKKTA